MPGQWGAPWQGLPGDHRVGPVPGSGGPSAAVVGQWDGVGGLQLSVTAPGLSCAVCRSVCRVLHLPQGEGGGGGSSV